MMTQTNKCENCKRNIYFSYARAIPTWIHFGSNSRFCGMGDESAEPAD